MSTPTRTFAFVLVPSAALLAVIAGLGLAHAGPGKQPGKRPMMAMPAYDRSTEITVKGIVQEVKTPDCPGGWVGVHPVLKTDKGSFEVHLGPAPFLAKEKLTVAAGDALEIVGSKVQFEGRDVVLARRVTKDGRTLDLRDETGKPAWSGPMGPGGPMRRGRPSPAPGAP